MEEEKILTSEGNGIPQAWNSIFGMPIQGSELNQPSEQLPNSLFHQFKSVNCDNPMTQMGLFESALTLLVSSPVNSMSHPGIPVPIPAGDDSIVLRELIGRLGSICKCNSSGISTQFHYNGSNSDSNSCYNTPLNSPQKLNQSITDDQIQRNHQLPLAQFPTDPGFIERAAKFSTFGGKNEFLNVMESRAETDAGIEEQSISTNGRKRKGVLKGKGKETQSSTTSSAKDDKVMAEVEKEESDAKRSKSNEEAKGNVKSTDATKDYIHVRARRGQATDNHSLAERVRREKISERMKFLQDLVPGCNKVTGKAVILDEIINYVRSLQQQVEFLSMKLATVDPRMDVSMEALLSKDMSRPRVSMTNNVNPFNASVQPFTCGFQTQINGIVSDRPDNHQFDMNPLMVAMQCNSIMKPSDNHGFGEVSTLWENDLQSVVMTALGPDSTARLSWSNES